MKIDNFQEIFEKSFNLYVIAFTSNSLVDLQKSIKSAEDAVNTFRRNIEQSESSELGKFYFQLLSQLGYQFQRVSKISHQEGEIQKSNAYFEEAIGLLDSCDPTRLNILFGLKRNSEFQETRFSDYDSDDNLIDQYVELRISCSHDYAMKVLMDNNRLDIFAPLVMVSRLRKISDKYSEFSLSSNNVDDLDIALLCEIELLAFGARDIKQISDSSYILGNLFLRRYDLSNRRNDIEKSIEMYSSAKRYTNEDDQKYFSLLTNMGVAHIRRYQLMGENKDLESSFTLLMSAKEKIDHNDPLYPHLLYWLGFVYLQLFYIDEDLNRINYSIECMENAQNLLETGHQDYQNLLRDLGTALRKRYEYFEDASDIEKSIQILTEYNSLIPDGHLNKWSSLNRLGMSYLARGEKNDNLNDINLAIELFRSALLETSEGHEFRPGRFNDIGKAYSERYLRSGNIEDLDLSIDNISSAVKSALRSDTNYLAYRNDLGMELLFRYDKIKDLSDLCRAIELFTEVYELTPKESINKPVVQSNLSAALAKLPPGYQCK